MDFSVTQFGRPLDPNKYIWDEKTRTLLTTENGLVLDFSSINEITFKTGYGCTFKTGYGCTFDTGFMCNFNTGLMCTFRIGFGCIFNIGEKCVIIRKDIFEVIQSIEPMKIKLNSYYIPGYTIIEDKKVITIDGKDIEISQESYENLRKQLI